MQTTTLSSALLPGRPTWNAKALRFEESMGIDPAFLHEMGYENVDVGYRFFEPTDEPQLYLLRALRPGHLKQVTSPRRPKGKKPNEVMENKSADGVTYSYAIEVYGVALLQDATGQLYSWDIGSKLAFAGLLRCAVPDRWTSPPPSSQPALGNKPNATGNPAVAALKRQLQETFDATVGVWIHTEKGDDNTLWVVRGAAPAQRDGILALLADAAKAPADAEHVEAPVAA